MKKGNGTSWLPLLKTAMVFAFTSTPFPLFATQTSSPPPVSGLIIQKENVVIAEPSLLETNNKDFDFNWERVETLATNKDKIEKLEAFLKPFEKNKPALREEDREALASLLYKLGTFYTHIAHNPDLAIEKMEQAQDLLTNPAAKAWNASQLAYAYQQKYAAHGKETDKQKALSYLHQVTTQFYPHEKNQALAFAYCVQGLLFMNAKAYDQAQASFVKAVKLDESIPGGKDDQYARSKNELASLLLEQNGHEKQALKLLKEVKRYWQAKGDVSHNPYAAKNLMALGKAYLKMNNTVDARDCFNQAITIYQGIYGKDTILLVKPYQLLAEVYKKISTETKATLSSNKKINMNE